MERMDRYPKTPSRPLRALTVVLLALLMAAPTLVPASAMAQEAASDEAAIEQARNFYQQGVEAFYRQQYSIAITFFRRAYSFDAHPMFLYNISVAYTNLRNVPQAYETSRQAFGMEGLPPDIEVRNSARYRANGIALAAVELAGALAPKTEETTPVAAQPVDRNVLLRALPKDYRDRSTIGALGWTGIITAGLGVGAVVGSGVMSQMIEGDLQDYEGARLAGDRNQMNALRPTIESKQSTGQIVLYSGGGLVALGVTLLAVDLVRGQPLEFYEETGAPAPGPAPTEEPKAAAPNVPVLSGSLLPGGGQVGMSWKF